MRTLAIDLGKRRIGLAHSDERGAIATPLQVIEITSLDQAHDHILSIIQREQVQRIVLGLPLDMSGAVGAAARETQKWGNSLAQRTGLPVLFVDEGLSS